MANEGSPLDLVSRVLKAEVPEHDEVLELYVRAPVDGAFKRDPDSPFSVPCRVRSSFEAAYTDAQNASNGGTSWIGAIGHLVFFDVVGGALRRTDTTLTATNDFETALALFSYLHARQRAALYALRCALAHDYSLANIPKPGTTEPRLTLLRHHFQLFPDHGLGQLIVFPEVAWDGDVLDVSDTQVDLGYLADLAADVRQRVLDHFDAGHLKLSRPAAEIRRRYFFLH